MSDLIETPEIFNSAECIALAKSIFKPLNTRAAQVGDHLTIRRALPHRDKKTIGAWCFLDHFGPVDLKKSNGLRVGPHPHIGLQTFTYPLAGEIVHRDSLGSKQTIQPGQVNLMTAGKGISHSEESLPDSILHGVQLWIALPNDVRHMAPNFIHYPTIPIVDRDHLHIHVLAGEFLQAVSPVKVYSPLVGLELQAMQDTETVLPLNPAFEYGLLPLVGQFDLPHESIGLDTLVYFSQGQSKLPIKLKKGSRLLIIGGEPFNENILIWWNFVARSKEEMIEAAKAWTDHTAFGEVKGYDGESLSPPAMP